MITMICFFIVALILLVVGALTISGGCRDRNAPFFNTVCDQSANGTASASRPYFFALTGMSEACFVLFFVLFFDCSLAILLFNAIIGAAAAFSFWRMLRAEDEGGDKYVYLVSKPNNVVLVDLSCTQNVFPSGRGGMKFLSVLVGF